VGIIILFLIVLYSNTENIKVNWIIDKMLAMLCVFKRSITCGYIVHNFITLRRHVFVNIYRVRGTSRNWKIVSAGQTDVTRTHNLYTTELQCASKVQYYPINLCEKSVPIFKYGFPCVIYKKLLI